jgi:hypothetical protein
MIDGAIAGAFSGLFMAAITVVVGPIMLFNMAKNPSPSFRALQAKFPPIYMTMGIVATAYPGWVIIGVTTGILYGISAQEWPGNGLGSSNLVYTVAVTAILVMMAAPFAVLLKKNRRSIAATTLLLVVVFGWLLPFLAR